MTVRKFILSILFLASLLLVDSCLDVDRNNFVNDRLSGRIVKLEKGGKGLYELSVADSEDSVRQYVLFLTEFVTSYNVQVGDSLVKPSKSTTMQLFKDENGQFAKPVEYTY